MNTRVWNGPASPVVYPRPDTVTVPGEAERPTLERTAGHIGANVAQSHEWVDRIEMALFGGGAAKEGGALPPMPPGMESQLGSIASQSAGLASRLMSIAERIGG